MDEGIKIGIMGGTFNPIHNGHLLIAETAREACDLDEVLFIPSGCPYMKDRSELLDGRVRAAMTGLAIEGNPFFRLSTMELEREGNSYTCDTLEALREEYPSGMFYFIVGADSLFAMDSWRKPEKIFSECIILAAVREDKTMDDLILRAENLRERFRAEIKLLPMEGFGVSSTGIRERVKAHRSIRYMVPEAVRAYIEDNQLYGKEG